MTITLGDAAQIIAISGGCALVVAAAIWVVSAPLRRRSLRAALLVQGLACVAATLAGVLGTAQAMFLSAHDVWVTALVSAVVVVVVSGVGLLLSRQIAREHGVLRETANRLGRAGADSAPGAGARPDRPLAQEVEDVRRSLVEAGRALAESRARERAMVLAQQEMFAAMSHDLRTPLAGIRAMAEALEDGIAPDPAGYHARMRAGADRLSAMVDALFDLARPHNGSRDPGATPPTPVPLDDVVSDCLAGMEAVARSRRITLTGHAAEPVQLSGSTSELTRAVENVVTNALAATPAGGSVEVVLERLAGARPGARISVTDSCGGIDDADVPHVFDVGFRGSRPADRARSAPGGAGLGLAVTRRIVEAHHGTVSVSNVDGGCRFVLDLPATA